jgi:signal transduction histidine kinase
MDYTGQQITSSTSGLGEEKPIDGLMIPAGNSKAIDGLGFRNIIDLLPCYISIQDRSMHILFSNQNFKDDFGEGIGKLCHEVYKGSPERCEFCPVQKTFKDKKVHISEETVHLSTGEVADMIVYSSPILNASGNVAAVIEMSTNITKVKEMQKELKILGQSIAILSHDIKNILEGLHGGAYVVDEGIKDGDMELAAKGLDIVKRNITEISSMAQNILYSSKKRDLKYRKVSPNEIVRDVVDLFQEKANAMDIQLKHETNQALPLVRLDPMSIRRMLENFICNALDACKKDKEKDFHAVVVRADLHDKFHFKFEVEDNGVGMDEETKASIFDEFYSTKGGHGTGLGLLVVDKIVKEHGGKVEVLTTPGRGSTFRTIFRIN